jgi:hypothetical protein
MCRTLDNLTLKKITQAQQDKYCTTTICLVYRIVKFIERENGERRKKSLHLMGVKFQYGKMRRSTNGRW